MRIQPSPSEVAVSTTMATYFIVRFKLMLTLLILASSVYVLIMFVIYYQEPYTPSMFLDHIQNMPTKDTNDSIRKIMTLPLYTTENVQAPTGNMTTDMTSHPEGIQSQVDVNITSIYGKIFPGTDHTLLYNRVPKCGSRTFVSIADMRAKKHNGRGASLEIINNTELMNIIQKKRLGEDYLPHQYKDIVRTKLLKTRFGTFLHGHVYHINFNDDDTLAPKRRPIYFNIIRDPVDRFISEFYFVRNGDGKFINKKLLLRMVGYHDPNETIDDCLDRSSPECVGPDAQSLMVRYFCGYNPECREPTELALKMAQQNIEDYIVVGLLEEYLDYLKVLEILLPDNFKGIVDEYQKYNKSGEMSQFETNGKIPPSEKGKGKLKTLMEIDYKFYNYTREKFHRLKRTLGVM